MKNIILLLVVFVAFMSLPITAEPLGGLNRTDEVLVPGGRELTESQIGPYVNVKPKLNLESVDGFPLVRPLGKTEITAHVTGQYYAWPGLVWDHVHLRWVMVAARPTAHTTSGPVYMTHSLDGVKGQQWSSPVEIISGNVHRDTSLMVAGSSMILTVLDQPLSVPFYKSDDGGESWHLLSRIYASGETPLDVRIRINTSPVFFRGKWLVPGFEGGATGSLVRIWSSDDGMRTWETYSTPIPFESTSHPNESRLVIADNSIELFTRWENPGVLTKMTSEDGITWSATNHVATLPEAIEAETDNDRYWRPTRPDVIRLDDGRYVLAGRNIETLGTTLWSSSDNGLTFPNQIDINTNGAPLYVNEYSEFEPVEGGYIGMGFAEEWPTDNTASRLCFSLLDARERPLDLTLADVASTNITLAWVSNPQALGSVFGDNPAPRGAVNTPSYITSGTNSFFGSPSTLFDNDDALEFGTTNDYNYLHNGSPYTIGICWKRPRYDLGSMPLIHTCQPTSSGIGWGLRDTRNAIYLSIWNGTGTPTLAWTPSAIDTNYRSDWNVVVITSDGTNHKLYLNGQLQNTMTNTGTPSVMDSTEPLYVGQLPNPDIYAMTHYIRSVIVLDKEVSDEEVITLSDWLESKN